MLIRVGFDHYTGLQGRIWPAWGNTEVQVLRDWAVLVRPGIYFSIIHTTSGNILCLNFRFQEYLFPPFFCLVIIIMLLLVIFLIIFFHHVSLS